MGRSNRALVFLLVAATGLNGLVPAKVDAVDFLKSMFKGPGRTGDPCVERLAGEIDWLERHLDQYGSVVCKQPDIWGQARLTKHRDEYEKKVFEQLNQFKVLLNGTLAREDQAFLANSFALSAALGTATRPIEAKEVTIQTSTTGTFSNTSLSELKVGDFHGGDSKIALEPEIMLDQLSRYLSHLHELRRINEGDDTADSPGYSLNLVRIPVSVSPGRVTRDGYGAEVTITATPYLNEELLPITFRNLVINDLVDQLALPVLKLAESRPWEDPTYIRQKEAEEEYSAVVTARNRQIEIELRKLSERHGMNAQQLRKLVASGDVPEAARQAFTETKNVLADYTNKFRAVVEEKEAALAIQQNQQTILETARRVEKQTSLANFSVGPSSRTRTAQNAVPGSKLVDVFGSQELITIAHTFAKGYVGRDVRWNGHKNSIVHLPDVQRFLESELNAAFDLLSQPELNQPPTNVWDQVAGIFNGAPDGLGSFVLDVSRGDVGELVVRRKRLYTEMRGAGGDPNAAVPVSFGNTRCIEALAWAVLVESALLNDHLIDDMKSAALLRGCGCVTPDGMQFYLPNPHPPERQAFMEYVRCRWPIHVFALDPVTQDQNIADAATIRREMQLAVSLAFTTGRMNATNFTKFVRKFESEYQTIALNRTVVGFSHGDDTFGWRFFPRFQTPAPKGTVAALHETIWGPSPDGDLMHRKIEPGPRECVAIVIMPSFVPYVTMEVRTNWFRLNHHHGWLPTRRHVEPSMTDTVKLSRSIKSMHDTAMHVCDAGSYRDGEVARLLARVHQLDRELPLQTMVAQVPIENTVGGFEMFSNGVTDLAPNLYGWYGGPGILASPSSTTCCTVTNTTGHIGILTGSSGVEPLPQICPSHPGTTLFLVGDHFSVHDTKVIAGDQCLCDVTLLSRQIMRVTIPGGVVPNLIDGQKFVDVHVATPYGVTSHLHIPYVENNAQPAAPVTIPAETVVPKAAEAPNPAGGSASEGEDGEALPDPSGPTLAPPPKPRNAAPPAPDASLIEAWRSEGGIGTAEPRQDEFLGAPPTAGTVPHGAALVQPDGNGAIFRGRSEAPARRLPDLRSRRPAPIEDRTELPVTMLQRMFGWNRTGTRAHRPYIDDELRPVAHFVPLPPID